jgi:hypothetical protein
LGLPKKSSNSIRKSFIIDGKAFGECGLSQ